MRKWVPVWEDLDGEGGEAFISTGIALGVRVETRIKYRAAYARFIDFLVRNNLAKVSGGTFAYCHDTSIIP